MVDAVDRLATGPTGVLRSAPGEGLLLLNALPQSRLRMSELPLLLLELGVAHGGARAGGSTWDYGRPRSYARVDPDQSGTPRRSPGPSGVADDDRSTTFESVDFARDDSFRAVLGLIREFHDMAEPATVPGARCKTSLASAYGLAADSYPAFSLPLSPLLSTLLIDINSDLSKFMEDQTVYGFLPVPGRRQRRYYGTSTSSFPGPYTVPPGLTSITMEKASEVRKRSVSLSASQVSSLETMPFWYV